MQINLTPLALMNVLIMRLINMGVNYQAIRGDRWRSLASMTVSTTSCWLHVLRHMFLTRSNEIIMSEFKLDRGNIAKHVMRKFKV